MDGCSFFTRQREIKGGSIYSFALTRMFLILLLLNSLRNNKETMEFYWENKDGFYNLLANSNESESKLISKVIDYLKNFWNHIERKVNIL